MMLSHSTSDPVSSAATDSKDQGDPVGVSSKPPHPTSQIFEIGFPTGPQATETGLA
jgi:hypothetical protein